MAIDHRKAMEDDLADLRKELAELGSGLHHYVSSDGSKYEDITDRLIAEIKQRIERDEAILSWIDQRGAE